MLRSLIGAGFALLLVSAAAADTPTASRQADTDRPGGTYASLPAEDANACAAHCARDGLCLAWTYQPAASGLSCALKAVVTPARMTAGAMSGVSARAPGFAALVGAQMPPQAQIQAPKLAPRPVKDVRTPALAPKRPLSPDDGELLGGPNDAS